jgi:hypothetical protein
MEGFATAAALGVTRPDLPSSWAVTREVDFDFLAVDFLAVDGFAADTTGFFLGAGFAALTPSFTACAPTAGAATTNTEVAMNAHKKNLENTVTKRLFSNSLPSLWHKKKTRNIKNLRNISQVAHWITQVVPVSPEPPPDRPCRAIY